MRFFPGLLSTQALHAPRSASTCLPASNQHIVRADVPPLSKHLPSTRSDLKNAEQFHKSGRNPQRDVPFQSVTAYLFRNDQHIVHASIP